MSISHDVFAETNPAYCLYIINDFIRSYHSIKDDWPDIALIYIAIPLALSGDLSSTFNGTNRNTGFLEWLGRNPKINVGLADRINNCMSISSEAIRFGFFSESLSLSEEGYLIPGNKRLKKSILKGIDINAYQPIKIAERLGYWFAMSGSTRNIINHMGLTV